MRQDVERYRSHLDKLFSMVNMLDSIEMRAQWAQYLCVLVSGFIEESVRTTLGHYASGRSSKQVANYVQGKLRRVTNLNMTRIVDLLSQFDPDVGKQLDEKTHGELKDAIDSIVANRHSIVHGRSVSVTYAMVKDWYKKAVRVMEILSSLLA